MGVGNAPQSFNNDELSPAENASDIAMDKKFWVNAPYNSCSPLNTTMTSTDPAITGDVKNGFNDPQFRLLKLCDFLSSPCSKAEEEIIKRPKVLSIMRTVGYVPLPKGSH